MPGCETGASEQAPGLGVDMGISLVGNMDDLLPLRDVVFNTLRQAILTGELKPGERLMEIHLADKLGVSRTPVREAIRRLELEGLVTMIPRRGAEVARMTEKNMDKLKSSKEGMRSKLKKVDKTKLLGKILAGVLAALMILSIAATCIYAIISMVK